jgi:release factor glutamine methyltransferase
MTLYGDAIQSAKTRFADISTSPGLDAQLLLAEVTGQSRAHVLAHREKSLTAQEATRFDRLVARRADGEPMAYILGRRAFYDRDFTVTPAVLIPRPETEHLLEAALEYAQTQEDVLAVDVGTGSGALAVTFAANAPNATVYATDISPDALAVAGRNARNHDVAVTFLEGDLLRPLIERKLRADLIMANLPYIPSGDLRTLAVGKYEPALALDGGSDGLAAIRRLLKQIPDVANPGALILLEIGADQGAAASQMAREGLRTQDVRVLQDLAGLDRVVRVQV